MEEIRNLRNTQARQKDIAFKYPWEKQNEQFYSLVGQGLLVEIFAKDADVPI
jgi:hypothetical protein